MKKIFIHLPAYREPELIPTIEDALARAKYPKRLRFGICRQYNPLDEFDNVDKYRTDARFKIIDIPFEQAKGLPYARARINELITDEDYILQLDAHHRFVDDWDDILIKMHTQLEKKKFKPILTGYLPYYNPFNDPAERTMQPWKQEFACFYPHGTIFIRPTGIPNWQELTEPIPSRFISGHFAFARTEWAKEIKHDPDIYFSGEELNLTVRSFTHGWDLFHPHRLVIFHATMREERSGKLIWDDQYKRGENWWSAQDRSRAKIRQLLRTENNKFNLSGYDLGTVRTLHEYERYAGVCFKNKSVQQYTLDNNLPPNPPMSDIEWKRSLVKSFYHLVTIYKHDFPNMDYASILVAFDDEHNQKIHHRYIDGNKLKEFMENGTTIHYEEFFTTNIIPRKMVIWPYSKERGWCERTEYIL